MSQKNLYVSMVVGTFLVVMATIADTFNGIEFVNIDAGAQMDANGYGAVGYSYWISQNEISWAEFSASGVGNNNEDYWSVALTNTSAPAVNISWNEAAQYCNWLTSGTNDIGVYQIVGGVVTGIDRSYRNGDGLAFVLPTEDEWYRAAYLKSDGSGFTTYATGDSVPAAGLGGANYDGAIGGAWVVGTGISENNETSDMMGNAFEMLENAYIGGLNFANTNQFMMNLGGAYQTDESYLASSTRATNGVDNTSYRFQEERFLTVRLVIIPEPGTMSLMGLSTIGLFFTRSIRRRKRLGQTLLPVRQEHLCDVFVTEPERSANLEFDSDVGHRVLWDLPKDGFLKLWQDIARMHQSVDKAFWDRMVIIHERQVSRRSKLKKTLRKKLIGGFDAFLAIIMK